MKIPRHRVSNDTVEIVTGYDGRAVGGLGDDTITVAVPAAKDQELRVALGSEGLSVFRVNRPPHETDMNWYKIVVS